MKVCKTFIRRFDSDPRLQSFQSFSVVSSHFKHTEKLSKTRRIPGENWIGSGYSSMGVCA